MSKITNISIIPTGPGKNGEALPSDVIFTLDDGTSYTAHTVIPAGIQGLRGSQWTSGGGAAPTDAISGDVFFNTSIGVLYQYDGTNWNTLGNFVGKKGDSGVGVSDITYTSTPMDPGSPVDTTITFHKTDNTQNDVVIQTPPGPQGANGGPDPYAGPNEVNFSWYELAGYGARNTKRVTFPYGLVFKYPPRVDITFVMYFPSDQWSNFTENWSGDVTPQFAYDSQMSHSTAEEVTVSRTDFSFSEPGGWTSVGYIQYSVRGFIDPQKTADNQNKLGIKPPPRVQDITLSNIEIDQTTPTPGQNSQATWKATLSDGTIVQRGFTIPCGAQGLKGDTGLAAGIAMWYSGTTPPSGWLVRDGGAFDVNKYPELAKLYPNGVLPDDRGLFIRGYDPGGINDSQGKNRELGSYEEGSVAAGTPTAGFRFGVTGFWDSQNVIDGHFDTITNGQYPSAPVVWEALGQGISDPIPTGHTNGSTIAQAGVTRPKNRNYLPIISTGL